ncbi:CLUMA_CG005106, isoform A [Clunio marinus]|uniref:Cysteine-rich PDZ-binding protein n=1 Tax=Clunio marinus TaxID=568069 RepID=A0A1J1HV60_9DIPT|nr:CLUMA_CG005106, isoform A [Clunio marinus]
MVCEKCELKLKHVATPDPWKMAGRSSATDKSSGTSGGRKINENKALTSSRVNPMKGMRKCRICQSKIHLEGAYYCQSCAYKKGICGMCGKKIISTKSYRQSAT